ncbi:hypothetical protein ASE00_01440 [Sphingomonas sp. Root710]|uniref:nuclear transport factor 2 family protein n=1 Tax=Sphingomonas sp. Root710 TaxID=1736594 RepID=UPI0006FA9CBE|nr:nuclear transport factor 2 family protein [Sphingomonas sp. Root710]KRB85487.1 hypothetical protein ASE00_01440 [Sphingomonas sp. Root710]
MSDDFEQVVAELKARQDIHDLLVRYCRGVDRCDTEMIRSCFHEDGWDNHGFFDGPAMEFAEQAAQSLATRFTSTHHFMTNEHVEIDGDTARSETCNLTILRAEAEGRKSDTLAWSRYLDRIERRDGVWKIAHRTLVSDGTHVIEVAGENARLSQGKPGGRRAQDPSYGFFDRRPGAIDSDLTP